MPSDDEEPDLATSMVNFSKDCSLLLGIADAEIGYIDNRYSIVRYCIHESIGPTVEVFSDAKTWRNRAGLRTKTVALGEASTGNANIAIERSAQGGVIAAIRTLTCFGVVFDTRYLHAHPALRAPLQGGDCRAPGMDLVEWAGLYEGLAARLCSSRNSMTSLRVGRARAPPLEIFKAATAWPQRTQSGKFRPAS